MKTPITFATCLVLFLSASAAAEVYRHVDARGNVTYSDEPMRDAEVIQVKPVTTITLPKPQDVQEPERLLKEVERQGAIYNSLGFVSPENQQAFHSASGNITFQVRSSPELRQGHRFEVTLDGQPVGQSSTGSVTVNNVYRGTHQAGVNIVDQDGIQVKSGPSISFTVHRPSQLKR